MFGKNPIRPPVKGDGATLDIQAMFHTLQGEGPNAGHPSVFVRLGGCNLACDFCDTEFEQFQPLALENILAEVERLSRNDEGKRVADLVVITGGEPFRQPIEAFCAQLLERDFRVQIETNGTLYRPVDARVEIICSPKVSAGAYHAIRPDLAARITAYKFILSVGVAAYQAVPEVGQTLYHTPVYVQPMDEYNPEKNLANQQHALDLALRCGYRLSLQTHKILGIA